MLFTIDIGNSNICFGLYKGETQINSWRFETYGDVETHLNKALQELKQEIKDVIICSVVPNVSIKIKKALLDILGKEPIFVGIKNIDIPIDINTPEQMGADRMIVASAVCQYYKTPAIVVDMGTATTFDVIGPDNSHKGGVIAPGIRLSLNALEQAAAQLPMIDIDIPSVVVGKNTTQAMQSGLYWGYIELIEGVIRRIKAETGYKDAYLIATGGLAPLILKGTNIFNVLDDDLIFKGLVNLHKKLCSKKK